MPRNLNEIVQYVHEFNIWTEEGSAGKRTKYAGHYRIVHSKM
jgi:hypothetical protein